MQGSNRPKYLSESQLNQLIKAARKGRYGQRDATLVLLMARHGLRVTEAVDLKWDQVDFTKGHLARPAAQEWHQFCPPDSGR
jgi:integrase